LIAVVDRSKGFFEAIPLFPETIVQTCIVNLIRNSMDFASWLASRKDRKVIAAAWQMIYRAKDADAAREGLLPLWTKIAPGLCSHPFDLASFVPEQAVQEQARTNHHAFLREPKPDLRVHLP
jgi:transposase-like protein